MSTRPSPLAPGPSLLTFAAASWLLLHLAAGGAEPPKAEYISDSLSDHISSVTQQWGELGLNTAVKPPTQPALKLRIKDKEYRHGLGHHANGEIVVDLGGQFQTFQAELGIQWQGGQNVASVVFQIYVDDRKVFDSGIVHESDPPRPVTVSVEGADELRLVAGDAGDGITCDCADWADARLVRNPAAARRSPEPGLDLAPFARVATWDPKAMGGTKASRVEEIPAEDLFPARAVLPAADGSYLVPVTDHTGCIGLQWEENRRLRQLVLQFPEGAAPPPGESIQLQLWSGESAWQGKWQPAGVTPEMVENRLVWRLGFQKAAQGTQKVRWLFAEARPPLVLKGLSAFSRSRWRAIAIRIEPTQPGRVRPAALEVYNGILLNPPQASPYRCAWDGSRPLLLKVQASVAQPYKADRTVLRFQLPDTAFGVAIEDLLANDCVYVPHAGLFVTRVPPPVGLEEYLKRIASRTTVLEQVRRRPDQDFPKAWAAVHLPVEDLEPTMLSLACDNRKFIVRRDGALTFGEYNRPDEPPPAEPGQNRLAAQWQLVPHFGSSPNPRVTRQLRGGWLPMPETIITEGNLTCQQVTCVAPASEAAEGQPAWLRERALCVVEWTLTNGGTEPAQARLRLNLSSGGGPKRAGQFQEVPEGLLVTSGDRLLALLDTRLAAPLSLKQEPEGLVVSGSLPGGAGARCAAYLPAWKSAPADYASLVREASWAARVESYWKTFLAPAMQIEAPDVLLNNIIRASQVHCAIAARNEGHGARIAPWIASAAYGPLESEANSIIRGMDMTGHADFARRCLEYFLTKRKPAGFITTGYTLVGTGEFLWTLGEHYERTRPREWLRQFAPDLLPICQWVIRQRAKTRQLEPNGQKVPEYGLMPPGVTADWGRFAYRFFNDAQYCAGLELAGRALAESGEPAAAAILEEARQYRADLVRAFHWTQARAPVVALANGTWVPADPAILNCFGRVEDFLPGEDGGRTWCYSVEAGAHHLAANRILAPASRDVDWMVDYLEDVQFLRSGWPDYPEANNRRDVFDFGGFAKLQPYYCRIAEVYALRDEVKPFVRSCFNTIPSLLNGENLSFCEHFHNFGAWNKTHETGWFLCQAATMFLMERGDELWLAPFVTSHWLEEGMKVVVRNAPTRFGKVAYTLQSSAAKGQIEARVELPPRITARKVVLRLRHPEGKPMQSVEVQGKPHRDFDRRKETITLAPAGETIVVRARY
ncbi:MAG: NPCBM/NEW2 domain-containing protein [Verrucomicrobiota bacterium]